MAADAEEIFFARQDEYAAQIDRRGTAQQAGIAFGKVARGAVLAAGEDEKRPSGGLVQWNGHKYLYVRIAEGQWIQKHILIWTQANGPVPNGYNIVFRDGDTQNCVLENLECISDAELMSRNTMNNLPEDVQELIYLKSRLTRVINETTKNKNHERT